MLKARIILDSLQIFFNFQEIKIPKLIFLIKQALILIITILLLPFENILDATNLKFSSCISRNVYGILEKEVSCSFSLLFLIIDHY